MHTFQNITIFVSSMKAETTTQQLPCQRTLPVGGGGGLRSFRRVVVVVVVVVVAAGLGVTGVEEGLACEVLVIQGLLRLSVVTTTKQQQHSYTTAENKQLMLSTLSVCVRASSAGTNTKYLYQAVKLLVMTCMRVLWLKFPPCYIHNRDENIIQSSAGNKLLILLKPISKMSTLQACMLCFANNITISQVVIFHYTLRPIKYQNYEETSSAVGLIGSKDKEIPCIG